jgi:trans-2-enoyl-CoA reductase
MTFMDWEPSSINQKNASRLTRRRVMKLATAAGFSTATAMAMTPADVKAQDSDQVTISFDISGRKKKTVDADWYDHVQRSKRVRNTIESKYFDRDGINGVGIGNDGGTSCRGNPR